MEGEKINGARYAEMLRGGTEVLGMHAKEVNDLNVFPIPDGDTGENMLLTIKGGAESVAIDDNLSATAKSIADGMLLSARGNSGVILSQFFEGISEGFKNVAEADGHGLENAFKTGVEYAYKAVLNPTEGTILTVIREATEFACAKNTDTPLEFLGAFIEEAKRSLKRTPELLPVLKNAGVVDSGGAGIVYIAEGMQRALSGEEFTEEAAAPTRGASIDYSAFDENTELTFGYCTELLLRLQWAKTDVNAFDQGAFAEELKKLGESVVTVSKGSIVKVHVHTKTPHEVLEFCQEYGEFLSVKIENMNLQHGSLEMDEQEDSVPAISKDIATVTVASGAGVIDAFKEMGADAVIDGGRSLNPSAEDFIHAFKKTNAKSIIVLPNNSNSFLAAKQAASLYTDADIRVVESKNVGEGYAALSMLDTECDDIDAAVESCTEAMAGVSTAEISMCVRDAEMDGFKLHTGDCIAILGKRVVAASKDRFEVFKPLSEKLSLSEHEVVILIRGEGLDSSETEAMRSFINENYPNTEVYIIDGGQDIYDCILIAE